MHGQLFQMLIFNQLERFLLGFPGGLQESLGKEDFTLLDQAPERVVPDIMMTRHLFGLLHQR